jgi:hypothetical protein
MEEMGLMEEMEEMEEEKTLRHLQEGPCRRSTKVPGCLPWQSETTHERKENASGAEGCWMKGSGRTTQIYSP